MKRFAALMESREKMSSVCEKVGLEVDSKNSITIIEVTTADGHYECIIFCHYDPSVPTGLSRDTLSGILMACHS